MEPPPATPHPQRQPHPGSQPLPIPTRRHPPHPHTTEHTTRKLQPPPPTTKMRRPIPQSVPLTQRHMPLTRLTRPAEDGERSATLAVEDPRTRCRRDAAPRQLDTHRQVVVLDAVTQPRVISPDVLSSLSAETRVAPQKNRPWNHQPRLEGLARRQAGVEESPGLAEVGVEFFIGHLQTRPAEHLHLIQRGAALGDPVPRHDVVGVTE